MARISVRAIIEVDNKYLLVSNKVAGDFWHLPGGRVEEGENVKDALEREIIEEIGIKPDIGNLLAVHQVKYEGKWLPVSLFFHVTNSNDFLGFNIKESTHGVKELEKAEFKSLESISSIKPEELKTIMPSMKKEGFQGKCRSILA